MKSVLAVLSIISLTACEYNKSLDEFNDSTYDFHFKHCERGTSTGNFYQYWNNEIGWMVPECGNCSKWYIEKNRFMIEFKSALHERNHKDTMPLYVLASFLPEGRYRFYFDGVLYKTVYRERIYHYNVPYWKDSLLDPQVVRARGFHDSLAYYRDSSVFTFPIYEFEEHNINIFHDVDEFEAYPIEDYLYKYNQIDFNSKSGHDLCKILFQY